MLEKIIKNKRKLIIIGVILTAILGIIGITLVNKIGQNNKVRQIAKAEEEYGYNKPYIPEGFTHVEGQWNTGYVIEDSKNQNQFVWIPIDGTTVTFQRKNFSTTDVGMNACTDEAQKEYMESVEKYGGYYVARYEAGIPQNADFQNDDMDVTGKPVSKKGAQIWNNISYTKAKTNAEQMYATNAELTSSLMNSYAYDTMLIWLEANEYNVETDSKNWGNYANNSQTNHNVENAGNNVAWKANNIYDIAGNVSEWTTEETEQEDEIKSIYRGGSYYNDGNITPAGIRQADKPDKIANNIGFRAILYKTGNPVIEGYNEPYIPNGFTHIEGEWNTGYVIKENTTRKRICMDTSRWI